MSTSFDFSNGNVVVDTDILLEQLYAHRNKHIEDVAAAWKGYYLKLADLESSIEIYLSDAYREDVGEYVGEEVSTSSIDLNINKPVSFLEDIDNAISMVESAQQTNHSTVELSDSQFKQWYQGKWSWGRQFATANTAFFAKTGYQNLR
jgi:hypothetical protein